MRPLKALEPFFELRNYDVAALVTAAPSEERVQIWRDTALHPFDPFVCAGFLPERIVTCPECNKKTEVRE